MSPEAGDFGVVRTSGFVAWAIRVVTRSKYNHAFICMGDGSVVEAQPGGAVHDALGYTLGNAEFSRIVLSPQQRERICTAALLCVWTPYGFLDILSIGLLQYGIKPKFIRNRVEHSKNLICSQLVDFCYQLAGVHLFRDGRLPMDVTPGDLATLIP